MGSTLLKNKFNANGLLMMSGPCVIESEAHTLHCAETLVKIFDEVGVTLVFKASYDKANRSSIDSFRGPGLDEGLRILQKVKDEFGIPVVTDVHTPQEATAVGEVVDMIQIPAFLCRQTDLLVAAAKSGKVVSIKKGQFMAPWDMEHVLEKVTPHNDQIILVDRGTSFGYNNLVSDMRAIAVMKRFGFPVCFDASHSVQLPGGCGKQSGGQREFIPVLARAAVAAGADCLFMETHPNPAEAMSDAASVMPFEAMPRLLRELKALFEVVAQWSVESFCS
jgi:2-dehydro-3-deoxyphosphooctonate aldolase (KDO 8-P synthase)